MITPSISRIAYLGITLLFAATTTFAAEGTSTASASKLEFLNFRAAQISGFQDGGTAFSAELSWNPTYWFSEKIGIVGNFGATILPKGSGGVSADTNFFASEYELRAAYNVNSSVLVELGGGAQTWFTETDPPTSTSALASLTGSYKLTNKFFMIDRVFAGYSSIFSDPITHMFKAGVQATF